jgi:hypothetical protein
MTTQGERRMLIEGALVLADSGNFKTDPGEMAGGARTVTVDDDAAVYLVRKDERLASPDGTAHDGLPFRVAPTTGHFYGRWDDTDGVRVIFEHMDRMDLGLKLEHHFSEQHSDIMGLGREILLLFEEIKNGLVVLRSPRLPFQNVGKSLVPVFREGDHFEEHTIDRISGI